MKPYINTGKYWNLNSADFAQHCIFAVPKAALSKAMVYLEVGISSNVYVHQSQI